MKSTTIIKYFLVLISIGILSCSSDDNGDGGDGNSTATSITLSANVTDILTGGSVTFATVDNLGNNVTSTSSFTKDGSAITNPYTFNTAGSYTIVSTKGSLTSNSITIVVSNPPTPTSITLTTNGTSFFQGDNVTMTVMDDLGNNVSASATFTLNGVTVSNPYTLTNIGNADIIATYQTLTSNTVTISVAELPSFTTKILLSDYTGTWCGACPIAGRSIHDAKAGNPNIIPVGFHNGDSMANTYSDAVDNFYGISSYPTVQINGAAGNWSWSNFPTSELNPFLDATAQLGLGIATTVSGTNIDITVKVGFANVTSTNLKLTVYLVEDGIVASQANYYVAGHPDPWPDYVHDDILRRSYTDAMGDDITSSEVVRGGEFTRTFSSVAIPNTVANADNARIVAFVSDSTNKVLNIQTVAVGSTIDFD
jgi:hypothetical protein